MWTLANPIKHAANEKGLVTCCNANIDSNNLVPSFVGVDARMHIHRTGSGLRPDAAAQSGKQQPRGGGPAACQGQGARGRADERWPGASAVCDRLVNFVRSQRVSVVTLSSTFSEQCLCRMGCPRPNSVAFGSYQCQGSRGGGESPGGGGVAGGARRGRQGASAAEYLWISGFGASLLASLGGSLHSRCR